MGICEILTIIFVIAKIMGMIHWNWFFVLLPEIIAFVLYAVLFVIHAIELGKLKKVMRDFDDM